VGVDTVRPGILVEMSPNRNSFPFSPCALKLLIKIDFASECFNVKGYERCLFNLITERIFEVSYSFAIVLGLFRSARAVHQCLYL
jgi:hypothetical protein